MAIMTVNRVEREILEALRELRRGEQRSSRPASHFPVEAVWSRTSQGDSANGRFDFLEVLDALEGKGLITQIKHPADWRERMIALSNPGFAFLLQEEGQSDFSSVPSQSIVYNQQFHAHQMQVAQSGSGSIHQTIQSVDKDVILSLIDALRAQLHEQLVALSEVESLRKEIEKAHFSAELAICYLSAIEFFGKAIPTITPIINNIKQWVRNSSSTSK